jgi:hypothetical protein
MWKLCTRRVAGRRPFSSDQPRQRATRLDSAGVLQLVRQLDDCAAWRVRATFDPTRWVCRTSSVDLRRLQLLGKLEGQSGGCEGLESREIAKVMHAYGRMKRPRAAVRVLHACQPNNGSPLSTPLSTRGVLAQQTQHRACISACVTAGDWQSALSLYGEAAGKQLVPLPCVSDPRVLVLDLHGCDQGVAVAGVRWVLERMVAERRALAASPTCFLPGMWSGRERGAELVVGKGLRSQFKHQPVVRPAVVNLLQAMGLSGAAVDAGNMGVVSIKKSALTRWADTWHSAGSLL